MPLKQNETFPAGGVSSRDNPVAMPPNRYLMLKNFWPQTNGELRLRDGYSLYANGLQPDVPIHSIVGIVGPGPDYKRLIVFWQAKTPYLLDPETRSVSAPTVRGTAVQSGERFCYFQTDQKLYAFNGTDAKFFDGTVWRDVGLPKLTKDQADAVVVAQGLAAISESEAAAAAVASGSGGGWLRTDKYGEYVYLVMFDTSTNTSASSTLPLGGVRVKVTPGKKINITSMPVPAKSDVVKIPLLTNDGGTTGFPVRDVTAFDHPDSLTFASAGPTTVHAHCNNAPHLLSTGDIIAFHVLKGDDTPPGPFSVDVLDSLNFTFEANQKFVDAYASFHECFRLLKYSNASTSGSINQHQFILGGTISSVLAKETAGLPGSTIGGVQPGYQFCMSIRNKVTQHVGNRALIGERLNNSGTSAVEISGYPDVSAVDDEWELLIGRTGDGAEIPYAVIDSDGNYITADLTALVAIASQSAVPLTRTSNVVTAVLTFPGIVGAPPPMIPPGSLVNVAGADNSFSGAGLEVASYQKSFTGSDWTVTLTWNQSGSDGSTTAQVDAFTGRNPTVVTASDIDGDTELPSRNFPPPGTLDFNDQIAPDPPVSGTFKRAWVESDHCCGTLEGRPTIYRSGSDVDAKEGKFVGLPAQAWDPVDIETFPTAAPVACGQSLSEESIVYSREDSAVLSELASELGWQGPWNFGAAGQFAYTKGWNNLPFVISGEKQLVTAGSDSPVPISDEYEAALLSKIGDKYLGLAEMVYVRLPHKRVEVLRMNLLDPGGRSFSVIHDFNMRDEKSTYGQAYEEDLTGPLAISVFWTMDQRQLTRAADIASVERIMDVKVLLVPSVGDLVVVEGGTSFDGTFVIEEVDVVPAPPVGSRIMLKWSQTGPDETVSADVTVKNTRSAFTLSVVRDENQQVLVLAGGADGNLYRLYDGISDSGEFFTGEALSLKNIGPQRTGIKYLNWYGDQEAEFFIAKKLTTPASTSKMSALCQDAPEEVQNDESSNHWRAPITDEIEMEHAYVWMKLTGRATSTMPDPSDPNNTIEVANTMELNDPPHMPMETYGRVLMITPESGASNQR